MNLDKLMWWLFISLLLFVLAVSLWASVELFFIWPAIAFSRGEYLPTLYSLLGMGFLCYFLDIFKKW